MVVTDKEAIEFKEKCTLALTAAFYICYCIECGLKSISEARIKLTGRGRFFSEWICLVKKETSERLKLKVFDDYNHSHNHECVKTLILRLKEKGLFDSVDAFLSGG